MKLLSDYLKDAENSLAGENVVIRAIGSRKELSEEIREQIIKTENFTKNNSGIVMNIALNYGSREEIVHAVREIAEEAKDGSLAPEDITSETLSEHLYTKNQPDPDLIIRTSGEERLSNFMLWQAAYSEFYFSRKLWPDFNKNDLYAAIADFQKRGRRFGGV